jgi:uncharacterized protein (TIGR02265 family)
VADWLELYWDCADGLEGACQGSDGAVAQLGDSVCRRFLGSLVGKLAVSAAVGKSPIERLHHAPAAYGAACSFGQRSVTELDPRRGTMRFEREFSPAAFHAAAVRSALCHGGHDVDVRPMIFGLLEFELHVQWK